MKNGGKSRGTIIVKYLWYCNRWPYSIENLHKFILNCFAYLAADPTSKLTLFVYLESKSTFCVWSWNFFPDILVN